MDKRGEFNIQAMLISLLTMGLFMAVMGIIILNSSSYYDATGYDEEELAKFNSNQNLTQIIQDASDDIDAVTVESSWFDFFSGIWSKLLSPFKFIYRSFGYLVTIAKNATELFQLMPVFKDYFVSVIIVLVMVGIVLIKFGLGRQK